MAAPQVANTWKTFLAADDDTKPSDAMSKAVDKLFTKNKFDNPASAGGLSENDLQSFEGWAELSFPERAFAKRSLETINAAQQTKKRMRLATNEVNSVATPMGGARVNNPMTGPVRALLGSEASVAQLDAALEAASKLVDVEKLLAEAKLKELPFHVMAETHQFSICRAEVLRALQESRVAFLYMELTQMLPMWLSAHQMSGESDMAGGWAGDPRAVRDANDGVRYFRSWTQFLGAFIKMMIVMVATEMVSWPFILTYLSQLIQMAEQERLFSLPCCTMISCGRIG